MDELCPPHLDRFEDLGDGHVKWSCLYCGEFLMICMDHEKCDG